MFRAMITAAVSLVLAAAVCAVEGPNESIQTGRSEGFIYGTVDTRTGEHYTGVIRWGDEEFFWDDLFHSSKVDLPHAGYAEKPEEDPDATWWERMFTKIGGDLGVTRNTRVVAVRFGDLRRIDVTGSNDAVLTLRDGTELEVSGYSNDVGATVHVRDADHGEVEVPWQKMETITFLAAPSDVDVGGFRIHGVVLTTAGEFTGFIQWDSQESLSTDVLDGDSDNTRVHLEMGRITSIERRDSRSARVVLDDGSELVLSGTNDVNDDIRGIHVEDPRFGRVEIPWDEFHRVDFDRPGGSGRGYADFAPIEHLSGGVTTKNGAHLEGRLVFDLDEEWSWEMLDGELSGIDYTVPFGMVAGIEPESPSESTVRLHSGAQLRLEDSHDVDHENDGVLVVSDGGDEPRYVPWRDVSRIDFH